MRAVLAEYARHYNARCPHRAFHLQLPRPDRPIADVTTERIKHRPVFGGLVNEDEGAAYKPRSTPVAEF
ncbi:transposase [Candidatus Frankia datiscae]|uniref:transposase n=1 Tax=Candidatus Protofrankia californiensis TaxID=1839754 RepID=UPI0010410290